MRLAKVATASLLGAICALAANATPSTLIWIPSTDIQANNTWHLGIDNYSAHASGANTVTDYGMTYGFLDGRAEAGIDYLAGQHDPLYFNAKVLLEAEAGKRPALAVGLMNFGTKKGVTDFDMVYGLGSKTFGTTRWTLGYCHGNKTALGRDASMILAGIDGYPTKNKKWWGAADYQSGKNAFGALNFGVSYAFTDKISIIGGYDIYNDKAIRNTFTTQLDVNF